MKTYCVRIPIAGYLETEVEADSKESAIDAAMSKTLTMDDIQSWDTHRQLIKGNIFYGSCSEAEATEAE